MRTSLSLPPVGLNNKNCDYTRVLRQVVRKNNHIEFILTSKRLKARFSQNFNISVSGRFAQVEMFDITPGELWQEAGDIIEEKQR